MLLLPQAIFKTAGITKRFDQPAKPAARHNYGENSVGCAPAIFWLPASALQHSFFQGIFSLNKPHHWPPGKFPCQVIDLHPASRCSYACPPTGEWICRGIAHQKTTLLPGSYRPCDGVACKWWTSSSLQHFTDKPLLVFIEHPAKYLQAAGLFCFSVLQAEVT